MSRLRSALVGLLVAPLLLSSGSASAYDAENTHRWIAREAAELLVATYPGEYDEVLEYTDDLVEGAFHEDDFFLDGDDDPKTLRVMRHFLNPTNGRGLTFNGTTFPNAYEWNAVANSQNEWDYFEALTAYQHRDLAQAYFVVGHTVHLISDLTVPAHSHLDDHGPPFGDSYENHCSARTTSTFNSSLRTPPPGVVLPEFLDLEDAFRKTARTSYYRNLYPGNLDAEVASGVIADMFPNMSKGFFSDVWQIDGVGELGTDFYEEQPGFYYFKKNNVVSQADMIAYDPLSPQDRTYGPIASDVPMVERMADELVPVAIVHSAAVLKLFIDQARLLPVLSDPTEAPATSGGGCNIPGSRSHFFGSVLILSVLFLLRRSSHRAQVSSHV